jgi:hypothetical protein
MIEELIHILQLPERCLVKKKITKAFFKRNFEMTSAERTMLDDFSVVTATDWLASINPHSSNIPAHADSDYTFEEIQVIALQTTTDNYDRDKLKLIDFIHKFIPYHILLAVYCGEKVVVSTCLKRVNANDSNKRVMDKKFITEELVLDSNDDKVKAFIQSLAFSGLDKTNLKTLYDSYTQRIVALQTAAVTGEFVPRPNDRTKQDVEYLAQIESMETEIVKLQSQAKKETQMNKRVELNTKIQQHKQEIEHIKTLITA